MPPKSKSKGAYQGNLLGKITLDDLEHYLKTLNPRFPIMVHGPPGIGKTQYILTQKMLWPCLQLSMTTRQPEDMAGCPSITDRGTTRMNPPDALYDYHKTEIQKTCQRWVDDYLATNGEKSLSQKQIDTILQQHGSVFIDEADKAPNAVMVSLMRVLAERTLENLEFAHNTRFIIAANRKEDAAGAFHELPKTIRNRAIHFELVPNFPQWERDFAIPMGIHPKIVGFLDRHPDLFCDYQPDRNDYGFATPRSWEIASDIVYANELRGLDTQLMEHALTGSIGPGARQQYMEFIKYMEETPSVEEILAGADFPPDDRADIWVALVSRCVATAEQGLNQGKPDYQPLRNVCKLLVKMPDHKDNYKLLLATYLHRRPSTMHTWLDVDKMGAEHCESLAEIVMRLMGSDNKFMRDEDKDDLKGQQGQ